MSTVRPLRPLRWIPCQKAEGGQSAALRNPIFQLTLWKRADHERNLQGADDLCGIAQRILLRHDDFYKFRVGAGLDNGGAAGACVRSGYPGVRGAVVKDA